VRASAEQSRRAVSCSLCLFDPKKEGGGGGEKLAFCRRRGISSPFAPRSSLRPAIRRAPSARLRRRAANPPTLTTFLPSIATEQLNHKSQVLTGFAAGAAALLAGANQAQANSPVDLIDDRKAKEAGFDIIYEARDLSLTQNERDGLSAARTSVEETKKRVKLSEQRIDAGVETFVAKAYWTEAREELRRQVGTLRFDLNTLASAKGGKAEKKQGLALSKGFIAAVEDLDLSLRKKDKAASLAKLTAAKAKLDEALAYLL